MNAPDYLPTATMDDAARVNALLNQTKAPLESSISVDPYAPPQPSAATHEALAYNYLGSSIALAQRETEARKQGYTHVADHIAILLQADREAASSNLIRSRGLHKSSQSNQE